MIRNGAALALATGVLLACASDTDQRVAPEATNGLAASEPAEPEPARLAEDLLAAVTGRVVVTGSDPLVILVIVTDANVQYELVGEQAEPLWDLQQRQVMVRGRVVREAAGPGFPAQLEIDAYTLVQP